MTNATVTACTCVWCPNGWHYYTGKVGDPCIDCGRPYVDEGCNGCQEVVDL